MAAMTTALADYTYNGNVRAFKHPNHTAQKAKLITQKRKAAVGTTGVSEDNISVAYTTLDANDIPIPAKVTFSVNVRRPSNMAGDATEVTDALALFREIIASDNFGSVVTSQAWLQTP